MAFWIPLIMAASAAASAAGKASQASAAGRANEANILTQRDALTQRNIESRQSAELSNAALRENGLMNRAALDLKQREYADSAPRERYLQAILGNLASNMQDVRASRPAGIPNISFSGGLRPSAIGPGGRAAGAELASQAMMRLMKGDQFEKLPDVQLAKVLDALQLSTLPKASGWEKAGSIAGLIGGIGGSALAGYTGAGGSFGGSSLPPGVTGSLTPSQGGYTPPSFGGGGQTLAAQLLSNNAAPAAGGGNDMFSQLFR
jgi:hypothetical protein